MATQEIKPARGPQVIQTHDNGKDPHSTAYTQHTLISDRLPLPAKCPTCGESFAKPDKAAKGDS